VLHNDLKGDNVVLTSSVPTLLGAVINDFGKACEAIKGQSYNLSDKQKEYYKLHHPHIAPDLRDGKCKQSMSSDIYSFGRILNIVSKTVLQNNNEAVNISRDCMQYESVLRPDAICLYELITNMQ
jgi:serine/threonine protein kinase